MTDRREGKLPPLPGYPEASRCPDCGCGEGAHRVAYPGAPVTCPSAKLGNPSLKEAERWGVWCDTDNAWNYIGSTTGCVREQAESHAVKVRRARPGATYTVKPYPDAKQTSETLAPPRTETAPPLRAPSSRTSEEQSSAPALGGQAAEGGAAKVDLCATHRLAGERRRAELTRKIEANAKTIGLLKTELEAWHKELELLG